MAAALGARVYSSGIKEIGWSALNLTDLGAGSSLTALQSVPVLHWHGDTFDLPQGAVLLAGTETCLHQAFMWGTHTLAFQCHPEVRVAELENWYVGDANRARGGGL